jgi:outer membrane protein TolC
VASSRNQLGVQRQLFASQQALVQVKLLQKRIAVYWALGDGWTTPGTPASRFEDGARSSVSGRTGLVRMSN